MRITRVYTRTGDKGTTRLVGGQVVEKDHPRIDAYGTVDELNAVLGIVRVHNARSGGNALARERVDAMLHRIQNDLFNVGGDLATRPEDRWPGMYRVGDEDVTQLERWCDELNEDLEPLREFILPGGGPVGAFLHQARTVCRRAERVLVALLHAEPETGEGAMRYLNRLSDFLFVLGRWAARGAGEPEVYWEKPAPRA
jgi:cob(I)alamin adenosyltransferase